jgi:hypothetical protein
MKNKLAILMILLVMLPMIITASFAPSSVLAAPIVSPNTNIINESHGQDEPNIAINPLHNHLQPKDIHVAVGVNDYRGGNSVVSLYTSTDLTTWTYHSVSKPTYDAYGNPVLAYDSAGNLYYAYMAFQVDVSGNPYNGAIYVSKSTDEGVTWAFYTRVSSLGIGTNPYNDRPWLAIDQSNNYIYVSWTLWYGTGASCLGSVIMFARSTNGGSSFSSPIQLSSSPGTGYMERQWSKIAIGPSGKVYVTWRQLGIPAISYRSIYMATSTSNGASFGSEALVLQYPAFDSADYQSDSTAPATCTWPQLVVGPEGNLYIAWHFSVTSGNRDLNFIRSTDGGLTWSTPMTIASNSNDQFWPVLAVAPTGRIDMVWYDRRDDVNNQLINLYYTNSTDKGVTFDPNIVKVTTATSDTTVLPNVGFGRYFGDYIDLADTGDGAALAVWTDTRTGNQEVFISTISQPAAAVSAHYFYLMTSSGVVRVNPSGTTTNLINAYGGSYSIDILGDRLYVHNPSNGAIMIYNLQGKSLGSITPASAAKSYLALTALPKGRFALLDNAYDKVYFINSSGTLLTTANILDTPDGKLQDVGGIVVGNKLVVSENGNKQVIQFDLTTYARTILKDLSSLSASWLGAITYANGKYYVCTQKSIYSFTSSTNAIKVADIPESSSAITGISVLDSHYAYVCENFAGNMYKVDLATGTSTVFLSGLNYPKDMRATTGIIFSDGFESGSFSAWTGKKLTTGETATVVNTMAHHGIYSAKFTSNGTGGYEYANCYKSVSSLSEVYARGYFNVTTSGIVDNGDRISLIAFANASGYYAASAGWSKTGGVVKWSLTLGSTTVYSTTSPSLNTWYCVEIHWKKSTTTGLGELYVNGVKVCSITGKNTAPYGSVSKAIFGLSLLNCGSTTAYCDCTKIAIKHIGLET